MKLHAPVCTQRPCREDDGQGTDQTRRGICEAIKIKKADPHAINQDK